MYSFRCIGISRSWSQELKADSRWCAGKFILIFCEWFTGIFRRIPTSVLVGASSDTGFEVDEIPRSAFYPRTPPPQLSIPLPAGVRWGWVERVPLELPTLFPPTPDLVDNRVHRQQSPSTITSTDNIDRIIFLSISILHYRSHWFYNML